MCTLSEVYIVEPSHPHYGVYHVYYYKKLFSLCISLPHVGVFVFPIVYICVDYIHSFNSVLVSVNCALSVFLLATDQCQLPG